MIGRFASLALVLLVAACGPRPGGDAPPRSAAMPGPGEGGIGGTGALAAVPGGSGAGSGADGEIGVFGTVTGFGSVQVGGLRIVLPAGLSPLSAIPGAPPAAGIALGDAVAVEARAANGELVAHRLVRLVPLVGPVERVEPARRRLTVMGTTVRLEEAAILVERAAGGALPLERVRVGDWVAVGGLWRGSAVEASRLERLPAPATASVSGLLRETGWGGTTVGGTRVDLGATADLAGEGFAAAAGAYRGGRLIADRVASGAATLFPRPLDRLVVEAFLARNPGGRGYHLSGFGIPMDPASTVPPAVGRRSIFVGRYGDGRFLIERRLPVPEGGGRGGGAERPPPGRVPPAGPPSTTKPPR